MGGNPEGIDVLLLAFRKSAIDGNNLIWQDTHIKKDKIKSRSKKWCKEEAVYKYAKEFRKKVEIDESHGFGLKEFAHCPASENNP